MENVLYECAWEFDSFMMIPFLMLIAMFKALQHKDTYGFRRVMLGIAILVTALVSLFVVAEQIDQYNKIVLAYRKGNYQIVEGFVEQFHPMPPAGHSTEHFEVDGVFFEYSDATVMQGYHQTIQRGGVITGDGQYLRIGYITMDSSTGNSMLDNVIVYIEGLPDIPQ